MPRAARASNHTVRYSRAVEDACTEMESIIPDSAITRRSLALMILSGDDTLREWLHGRTSPDDQKRLGDLSSRPLLAGLSRSECASRLAQLLAEREPAYLSASIVVDTDRASVEEVAAEVARRFTAGSRSSVREFRIGEGGRRE